MERLLILDDDPFIHKLLTSKLSSTPFELSFATTTAEARSRIQNEGPFSYAICDLNLNGEPFASGPRLLFESGIPTLIFSATEEKAQDEVLDNLSFLLFLNKGEPGIVEKLPGFLELLLSIRNHPVFVINSSPFQYSFYESILVELKMEPRFARNMEEAHHLLKSTPLPLAILANHILEKGTGEEILQSLRQELGGPPPFLILTLSDADPELSNRHPPDGILIKGLPTHRIKRTLLEILIH